MAEADELCDRIAIVDHGRILALGSPEELKRRVQRESVFRLELDRLDGGVTSLRRLPGVVSAATAATDQADGEGDGPHTVEVILALVDDKALGGVVGALGGSGPRSLPSASRSHRSRTSSSSSSGAASATRTAPATTA